MLMRIRALGAGMMLAALMLTALGILAYARNTSVAAASDEITIASAADGNVIPVGNNFTVTLAVTASTTPYKSIQWELAYPSNASFLSAVYSCGQFTGESETQPAEDTSGAGLASFPGMTVLGTGSNCASLTQGFTTNALGT